MALLGGQHIFRRHTWGTAALALTVVFGFAACGGSDDSKTSSGAGASSADVSYAAGQIEKYTGAPAFVAPGPPIDARSAMQGKNLTVLPYSTAIPFDQGMLEGMREAADQLGFKLNVYTNQGDPSQWNQGVQSAITNHSSSLDLLTIDPNVLGPQIGQATAAGVKVISSHVFDAGQSVPDGLDGVVRFQYTDVGRLLADWTIKQTSGKAKVLIVGADDSLSTKPMVDGLKAELKERCGSSCSSTYISVPTSDWATKAQSEIQSALVKNSDVNYVVPIYDGLAQATVTALNLTQMTGQAKVATFNGSTNVLDLVRQGKVEMDIGEPLGWVGKLIVDAHVRLAAGQEVPDGTSIPVRIFTQENVEEAGVPAKVSAGYGDAEDAGFSDLWELSK